jgi:peroxiredoxin
MLNVKQAAIAPDFSVIDSEGKIVRLSEYRGEKHIVLVFNRGFS